MQTVSIDTQQPIVEPVSIDTGSSTGNPVSPALAAVRSAKASLALEGRWDKTFDDLYLGFINGDEDTLRTEASAWLDLNASKKKEDLILKVLSTTEDIPKNFMQEIDAAIPKNNPASVFEKAYAERVFAQADKFAEREGDTLWNKAYKEAPVITERMRLLGTGALASTEFLRKLQGDAVDNLQKQSWVGWSADLAKDLLSLGLYTEAKMRGMSPEVSFFRGLLGTNLHDATRATLALPHDQMVAQVTDNYNRLKDQNPTLALMYINALLGQSTSEETLENIISAVNLTGIPSIAGLIGRGVKGSALHIEASRAAKQIVQNSSKVPPTKAGLAEAVGDVEEAAIQKTATNVFEEFKGTNKPAQDALDQLPSGFLTQVDEINAGPSQRFGTGFSNILKDTYQSFIDRTMTTLGNMSQILRVPLKDASEATIRKLKDVARENYPGMANAIMDVASPRWNPFSNTFNYDLKIGNHAGLPFTDFQTAQEFAVLYKLPLKNIEIEQNGLGYFIRVNKPLRETDDVIRDLFTDLNIAQSPKTGLLGSALSWLRTPEDTMSQLQRINRKVVTYAQAQLRKLIEEERQYIQKIKDGSITVDPVTGENINRLKRAPGNIGRFIKGTVDGTHKKQWQALERTLKTNQQMKDPKTGLPGYFFESPQELEDFYMFAFKRMPEQDEMHAYFAHKRMVELDRVIRVMDLYRNKSRVGAESHVVMTLGLDNKSYNSPAFDGVMRKEFPGGDDPILVIGEKLGKEKVYANASAIAEKVKKDFNDKIKSGELRVLEIYDPELRPFQHFGTEAGGTRVRWVIAKNVETNPLSWDQLPKRGGGHFEYQYDWYIKQAKMRTDKIGKVLTHWYEGDNTVMPILLAKQGADIIGKLNPVIALLKKKDIEGAKKLFHDSKLPIEWKEFHGWFLPSTINGVKQPARLSANEPLMVVPKDSMIVNIDKELEKRYPSTFKDGTKHGSLARQFQVKYTGERDAEDLYTLNPVGTRGNPLYKYEPAELLDPIPMLNRALARVVNSNLMDDYKVFSVEHWVQQASKYLKYSDSEVKYSPFKIFNDDDPFKKDAPKDAVWALKSNRFKINQFVGQPSYTDIFLHSATQKLADFMYDTIGPKAALVPSWLIPKTKDPVAALRSMTYHFKLGLFALPQLIVQNMTYASIYAISPRSAPAGTMGAIFHKWAEINPVVLDKLDSYASKLRIPGTNGFKRGEFKEAYEELNKTGFQHVGGEYVNLDAIANYQVVQNQGRAFLDWGQRFFQMGEKSVRLGAWYTAFKEYRQANPFGRITNTERAKILDRADLLTTNMSRASASALHSGVFSLTSQFLSYQLRLSELFFSKRLGDTLAERTLSRTRMMAVYTAAFGFPAATGITGFPWGEYIKKNALEQGYVVGDNWATTLLNEGIPALAAMYATGSGDIEKGNAYNFGDRFGSQGFEVVKDVIEGDKPLVSLVSGAAGSTLFNMVSSLHPMFTALKDGITGSGEYNFKPEDFIDPLKEIQSVNATWHVIAALETGNWLSKKEHVLSKTSPLNAVFMAATGVQPVAVDDAFRKTWAIKDREELWKYAQNIALREFRRSLQASDNNDPNQARDYMKRAFRELRMVGFPQEKIPTFIAIAADRNKDLVSRVNWQFYLQDVPEQNKSDMYKAFQNTLRIQQGQQ